MTENDVNPPINNDAMEKRNEFIDHPRKYGQQEQVTLKKYSRSTALERPVLKYCVGGGVGGCLNRFYGTPEDWNNNSIK